MKLLPIALAVTIMSGNLAAQDIGVAGTISHRLKIPAAVAEKNHTLGAGEATKEIKLLKITLPGKSRHMIDQREKNALESENVSINFAAAPPHKVQLGMANVPVLDQGNHGSCVTFAITAAADAALKSGDYISQLCVLQLGNYLSAQGYGASGWNGTLATAILTQMDAFGIVSKEKEASVGCGGLTEYPISGEDPKSSIHLEEYHQISEPWNGHFWGPYYMPGIEWSSILDTHQALMDQTDTKKTLADIKATLAAGDRVAFGVLLPAVELGIAGAVGRHKVEDDTWVLTPKIKAVSLEDVDAGHEMVITGYDDNAVATDEEGNEYRGLLTLRNSWGSNVGYHGNFYMSYDYFKMLVIEAKRVRHPQGV